MPHVIVKLWPGRTEKHKKELTDRIVNAFYETMGIDEENVSIGFEEIPKENWRNDVYKPDIIEKEDTLYKKPGYNMP